MDYYLKMNFFFQPIKEKWIIFHAAMVRGIKGFDGVRSAGNKLKCEC